MVLAFTLGVLREKAQGTLGLWVYFSPLKFLGDSGVTPFYALHNLSSLSS